MANDWCPVPGDWWLMPSDWCLMTSDWWMVMRSTASCPVSGDPCLVTGAWCSEGTHWLVPSDCWQVSDVLYSVNGDWWPVTGDIDCLVTSAWWTCALNVSPILRAAILMGLTPGSKAMRGGDTIILWSNVLENSELTLSFFFLDKVFVFVMVVRLQQYNV